ncbi:MAG: TlpA family protein disulfide reductase [Nitrosomonas sp.]|nr:TlpA family protein disulfide reductase [Nitrosomonas sp.]
MKHSIYSCLLIIALILVMAVPGMAAQLVDRPAPECELTTLNGVSVENIQALKGKVVYVDFWASWCSPCVQSFPFMNQLQQDYGSRGLQVMGVNLDEKVADAEKFLSEYAADFSIVADPTRQCAKDFDVIAMPSSYLVDRAGVVRFIHRGFRPGETKELRLIVEQLLDYHP